MDIFQIQLHPNDPGRAVEYAKNALIEQSAIGLDFSEKRRNIITCLHLDGSPIGRFTDEHCHKICNGTEGILAGSLIRFRNLRIGDIVLVRGGARPVALVRITGPSCFVARTSKWLWYRYRFPVQILGWYKEDVVRWPRIKFTPPAPGTFSILRKNSATGNAILRWLEKIGKPPEIPPEDDEIEYSEGAESYRTHIRRERDPALVKKAKDRALEKNRNLQCEVCGFDFTKKYGELGKGFIECHHTIPISKLKPKETTKLKDIALLCSNCHRMVHRKNPLPKRKSLKTILAQTH
jgi:hypothetical protein